MKVPDKAGEYTIFGGCIMETKIQEANVDIENEVEGFIVSNFLFGDASRTPKTDVSLIETGILDSTGILELIQFVEERFGIDVAEDETVPGNLDSVGRIVCFIKKKLASTPARI